MQRKRSNRRSIWFIKTPNHQPQSFGDFAHGHYTAVVHQVNLLLLLLQEQGDFLLASTPTGDEEPYDMRETLRSFTRKPESTNCVFCLPHSHTYMSTRKERQAYSLLLQTTMEPLPHGLLVLSSSKPLTGRTGLQTEGRFSLLELHGDIITAWYTGILHRTRTRRDSRRHAL